MRKKLVLLSMMVTVAMIVILVRALVLSSKAPEGPPEPPPYDGDIRNDPEENGGISVDPRVPRLIDWIFPHFNKDYKKDWQIHGESAAIYDGGDLVKLTQPVIEFFGAGGPGEDGKPNITVIADRAEYRPSQNEPTTLHDNWRIVSKDVTAKSTGEKGLVWLRNEGKITSADDVVIQLKEELTIYGRNLVAFVEKEILIIKDDVNGVLNAGMIDNSVKQENGNPTETEDSGNPLYFYCDGELVFKEKEGIATLSDNVWVTDTHGMKLTADKMDVLLDEDGKRVTTIICTSKADYGVIVSREGDSARGNQFIWNVAERKGRLFVPNNLVEMTVGQARITVPLLIWSQEENKMITEGGGQLVMVAEEEDEGEKPKEEESKDPEGGLFKGNLEGLRLEWDGSMVLVREENRVEFHKNVHSKNDKTEHWSNDLSVFFGDGMKEAERLEATGDVRVINEDIEATGDEFEWDMKAEMGVVRSSTEGRYAEIIQKSSRMKGEEIHFNPVTKSLRAVGPGFLTVLPDPTEEQEENDDIPEKVDVIWDKSMTYGEDKAEFYGGVVANRGEMQLHADEMILHLDEETGDVRELIAVGNMLIKEGERQGSGHKLVWDASDGLGRISAGDTKQEAEMFQEGSTLRAETIEFSEKTNVLRGYGKGRLSFVPEKDKRDKPEDQDDSSKELEPTFITFSKKMSYDRELGVAIFEGNVEAEQGDTILKGQRVTAYVDESGEMQRITAKDDVYFLREGRKGWGDRLEWNVKNGTAILSSDDVARMHYDAIVIEASRLKFSQNKDELHAEGPAYIVYDPPVNGDNPIGPEGKERIELRCDGALRFSQTKRTAQFLDNVRVVMGDARLKCDKLDLLLGANGRAMDKLMAKGNVSFKDEKIRGQAENMTWDLNTDVIGLFGRQPAQVWKDGQLLEGKQIIFNRKTDSIKVEGVKVVGSE